MNGNIDWTPNEAETMILKPWASRKLATLPLVAITRVRNESLLLQDTLDHVAQFADAIFVYDDASEDDSFDIAMNHSCVAGIIRNGCWQGGPDARLLSETRHRGLLLKYAQDTFSFDWGFCFDADERYIGPICELVRSPRAPTVPGVRFRLFDAYMTADDCEPLKPGQPLLNFRRYFGPEYRDILMLWKNAKTVAYRGLDAREPTVEGGSTTMFYCQHYGKSVSVEQWEATCRYYVEHFPYEPYGRKWSARMGKAVHVKSDFGRPLYRWGGDLFGRAIAL